MSRVLLRLSLQVRCVFRLSDGLKMKCNFNNGRYFHVVNQNFSSKKDDTKLPSSVVFGESGDKSKETYLEAINAYKIREKHRKGHVEFITAALKYMKEFGVEKDLEVYRQLVDVMPKGKFVAQNVLQAEFMHYPKQQQCILELLCQMEYNRKLMN